uniref:hypothetical protein n=1 Tax=uncultured Psychrobacter sp. TaxID=259303 RepID=UPI00259625F3|nr:hypothetical protein [uncultured Psychrobacter sp.]
MKNLTIKLAVLMVSSLLLIACYEKKHDADYGFFQATAVYLDGDVQGINFDDLETSKYNDFIYKNVLVKFRMLRYYPGEVQMFEISEMDSDTVNALCLASIFVEQYQPMDTEMAEAHRDSQQELIRLRPYFLKELRVDRAVSVKYDCLEVVKTVD